MSKTRNVKLSNQVFRQRIEGLPEIITKNLNEWISYAAWFKTFNYKNLKPLITISCFSIW